MKHRWLACLLGTALVAGPTVYGQEWSAVGQDGSSQEREKALIIEAILNTQEAAHGKALDPLGRERIRNGLGARSLDDLAEIQKGTSDLLPKILAAATRNLVFYPVTPCRIIDTRVAGGPLTGGTTRDFQVSGAAGVYSLQGGNPAGCGIPLNSTSAAVINFVAVDAAGPGDLRVTAKGTAMPLASILNYTSAQNIANAVVAPLCASCAIDMTVQADVGSTQIVADILGYYAGNPGVLASGQTLTGGYSGGNIAQGAGVMLIDISFPIPLASAPNPNFIALGGTTTTNCPGVGQAAAGQLCVYEQFNTNVTLRCIGTHSSTSCGADPTGAYVVENVTAAGQAYAGGFWAVTAP